MAQTNEAQYYKYNRIYQLKRRRVYIADRSMIMHYK